MEWTPPGTLERPFPQAEHFEDFICVLHKNPNRPVPRTWTFPLLGLIYFFLSPIKRPVTFYKKRVACWDVSNESNKICMFDIPSICPISHGSVKVLISSDVASVTKEKGNYTDKSGRNGMRGIWITVNGKRLRVKKYPKVDRRDAPWRKVRFSHFLRFVLVFVQ